MPLGCHFERILKVQKVIWRVFWLHFQAFGVPILRGLCFQRVLSSKKMRRLQANPPRDLKETRFPFHGSPGASGGDPGSQRTSSLLSRPAGRCGRGSDSQCKKPSAGVAHRWNWGNQLSQYWQARGIGAMAEVPFESHCPFPNFTQGSLGINFPMDFW